LSVSFSLPFVSFQSAPAMKNPAPFMGRRAVGRKANVFATRCLSGRKPGLAVWL
jgi:hypothetical protein